MIKIRSAELCGISPVLLEEHADARDQAVVALLEEDAFGPPPGSTVDLECLSQLDVAQPGVDVRDPLYLQPMALQIGEDLAQVSHVVLLALDDVAERALTDQTLIGNRCGQAVPIVCGQALQVALNDAGTNRCHVKHGRPTQWTRKQGRNTFAKALRRGRRRRQQ